MVKLSWAKGFPLEPCSGTTKGKEIKMAKLIVVLLATCAVVMLSYFFFGSKLGEAAFHMPHFGWGVSWAVIVAAVVGFGTYWIVKGK